MGSAKYGGGKCHGAKEVKARLRHDIKDVRLKGNHTNPDIDKSRTALNSSYYGLSYEEACAKYDRRIEELDRNPKCTKRKDRVTAQNIVVPIPNELSREQAIEALNKVGKILINIYGEENLIEGSYHVDEQHKYLAEKANGKVEERLSMIHGSFMMVPELDGRLNGKGFSAIKYINTVNAAIDAMMMNDYGVRFMTGEKKKSRQSVESLKQNSAVLKAKDKGYKEGYKKGMESGYKECMNTLDEAMEMLDNAKSYKDADTSRKTFMRECLMPGTDGTIEDIYQVYLLEKQREIEEQRREAERRQKEIERRRAARLFNLGNLTGAAAEQGGMEL